MLGVVEVLVDQLIEIRLDLPVDLFLAGCVECFLPFR